MTITDVCSLSSEVRSGELLVAVFLDQAIIDPGSKEADRDFVLRVTYPTGASDGAGCTGSCTSSSASLPSPASCRIPYIRPQAAVIRFGSSPASRRRQW